MRDIKFRAWDDCNKYMLYEYVWFEQREGYIAENIQKPVRNRITAVMQFTGFLDKNRKEIYEGDIVKIFRKNSEYKKPNYPIGVIVFEDASFWIKPNEENWNWLIMRNRQVEVIGNIYENPELLDKAVLHGNHGMKGGEIQ